MMFASIQQYLTYILLGVIALLVVVLGVEELRLNFAQSAVKTAIAEKEVIAGHLKNSQLVIRQLADASEELSIRLKDSQDSARRDRDKWKKQHDDLAGEVVPNNCEGASIWAKDKIKFFTSKW